MKRARSASVDGLQASFADRRPRFRGSIYLRFRKRCKTLFDLKLGKRRDGSPHNPVGATTRTSHDQALIAYRCKVPSLSKTNRAFDGQRLVHIHRFKSSQKLYQQATKPEPPR